jgi:plasmid maintenance system antidote protein VapI
VPERSLPSRNSARFDPDWCISPGETLRDWRKENRLDVKTAAGACARMPVDWYEEIEAGKRRINAVTAAALEHGTYIPARLWLNLERAYRVGLAAGKKDVSDA